MSRTVFVRLTEAVSVAGQLEVADVAVAAAEGFTAIVNNRPDGEAADQPAGSSIAAAATAAGLRYVEIPVDHGGMSIEHVSAMAAALDEAQGPLLAFCRSGTRSANLWALAEAQRGGDPEAIVAAAASGHYDVSALLPSLRKLHRR